MKKPFVLVAAVVAIGSLVAAAAFLLRVDLPPRTLAAYLERRLEGHDGLLARTGAGLARLIAAMDRGPRTTPVPSTLRIGARNEAPPSPAAASSNPVVVASAAEVRRAIEQARPGDVVTLEPGTYRFSGPGIVATRPGRADAAIVVRATLPRTVVVEMDTVEGFVVTAPFWRFENLTIRGVCRDHSQCEHAFHVVGRATNFVARNNTLVDFNAHVKVNGQDRQFPDDGLFEGNTLVNTTARDTDNPVTPFDLVAASRWTVRGNLISDFVKARGDRISYGAFAKGGGAGNRFERNVVLCEYLLRDAPGSRIGLSLGGGGSVGGGKFCRHETCALEQEGSVVEANLVAFCSDDGIYVNRGANSRIAGNTLIDTGGIAVRHVESAAAVEGNLVDGSIRSRDGAALHAHDNLSTGVAALYLGSHPHRRLFRDAMAFDLAWAATPPRLSSAVPAWPDLCAAPRPSPPVYGAFEDIGPCLAAHPGASTRPP